MIHLFPLPSSLFSQVVRALKTFPDDEVIPPEVCQTLSDILQYDENHRRAIVRAGGVAAIVTTLQTQITNAEICDVCVGILGVLAENSSDASKNRNRMRRAKVRRERDGERERRRKGDMEREVEREVEKEVEREVLPLLLYTKCSLVST